MATDTAYLDLNKDLTPEQVTLREQTQRFAREVLGPASIELDKLADPQDVIREGSVFWDVFRHAYRQGRHIAWLPEAEGGTNLSPLENHIVHEETGWGSAEFAIGIAAAPMPFAFAATYARLTGDRTLMDEVVRPFVEDREARYVGCWAITEPQHGSDAISLGADTFQRPETAFDVAARPDGDDWIISGQKSAWVSNGTIASHALVFLALDRSRGQAGSGIAVVPLDLPGVSKGPPLDKLGQRALNQGEIFFDDVRIPKRYMLVGPDAYTMTIDNILAGANSIIGTVFTGLARAAFEEALGYAKERVQGGRPIAEHQSVQLKLFDMFAKVQAARALSRAAMAYNSVSQPPATQYAMAAKVFCTEAAYSVASDAVQLHGGYGLSKGMLVEKLFRDARAGTIADGANDVLSLVAARKLIHPGV